MSIKSAFLMGLLLWMPAQRLLATPMEAEILDSTHSYTMTPEESIAAPTAAPVETPMPTASPAVPPEEPIETPTATPSETLIAETSPTSTPQQAASTPTNLPTAGATNSQTNTPNPPQASTTPTNAPTSSPTQPAPTPTAPPTATPTPAPTSKRACIDDGHHEACPDLDNCCDTRTETCVWEEGNIRCEPKRRCGDILCSADLTEEKCCIGQDANGPVYTCASPTDRCCAQGGSCKEGLACCGASFCYDPKTERCCYGEVKCKKKGEKCCPGPKASCALTGAFGDKCCKDGSTCPEESICCRKGGCADPKKGEVCCSDKSCKPPKSCRGGKCNLHRWCGYNCREGVVEPVCHNATSNTAEDQLIIGGIMHGYGCKEIVLRGDGH